MENRFCSARRDFLKSAAAGTAGLFVAGVSPRTAHGAQSGWSDGMAINDAIDNMRVVCCTDPDMTTDCSNFAFQSVNEHVHTDVVQENMDQMARVLAQRGDADEAWAAIFRKPDGKQWSEVRAAIKVNAINHQNSPRIAVVDKLCKVFIGLGVPAGNIHVYDGKPFPGENRATLQWGSSYGRSKLPAGVDVRDDLGGQTPVDYPHGKTYDTATWLADGTIDILVNLAVNKGHTSQRVVGYGTLTLKNLIGTIKFSCPTGYNDAPPYNIIDLAGMYKGEPCCGGDPPRQQLAIVDSLWANPKNHTTAPSARPNKIFMGTFGPAVDYQTIHGSWDEIGGNYADDVVDGNLTLFGYTPSDIGEVIPVPPASEGIVAARADAKASQRFVRVNITARQRIISATRLPLAQGETPFSARIIDAQGRLVCRLALSVDRSVCTVGWDGRDERGHSVTPGAYMLALATSRTTRLGMVRVMR